MYCMITYDNGDIIQAEFTDYKDAVLFAEGYNSDTYSRYYNEHNFVIDEIKV